MISVQGLARSSSICSFKVYSLYRRLLWGSTQRHVRVFQWSATWKGEDWGNFIINGLYLIRKMKNQIKVVFFLWYIYIYICICSYCLFGSLYAIDELKILCFQYWVCHFGCTSSFSGVFQASYDSEWFFQRFGKLWNKTS